MSDLQCVARIFLLRPGPQAAAVLALLPGQEKVAATYRGAEVPDLDQLADRHRGEAVLVVGEHPHESPLVLVEVDADGRRVVPWELPGT